MPHSSWTVDDSRRLYNLETWGDGYFDISPAGELRVGGAADRRVSLTEIVGELGDAGLRLPVLLRFSDVLRDRVTRLCQAFDTACADLDYSAGYTAVYPIKVNQQYSVVREIVACGGDRVGLEAGSKPELLAVMGLVRPGGTVICNGYKDPEYVRLALQGQCLGVNVTLVVEKLSELNIIMAESRALGLRPRIGLRVRLATLGAGNWQNTGGEKSKFGLPAGQLLDAVERLRQAGMLDCLHLMHLHLGSQIANVRDIQHGMREAARLYVELRQLGAPIDCVDVGGGLGVDYEGTRSRSFCSMNYSVDEYAHNIVRALAEHCAAADVPAPHIISESGRALTAHHAVLVTSVVDTDSGVLPAPGEQAADAPLPLAELWRVHDDLASIPPLEAYHDVSYCLAEAHAAFNHGQLTLAQRAQAERLASAINHHLLGSLSPELPAHRDALNDLRVRLATKYFLNLSVFQSLPDVWGIDQVFPIVPIARLDEAPEERVTLCDLTCDSDGRIDHYVEASGLTETLPAHRLRDGETYCLAIAMVGAYQEILGDLHNLFGDTDTVNIEVAADGHWRFSAPEPGDRTDELLQLVHHAPDELLATYAERLALSGQAADVQARMLADYRHAMQGYTSLDPQDQRRPAVNEEGST